MGGDDYRDRSTYSILSTLNVKWCSLHETELQDVHGQDEDGNGDLSLLFRANYNQISMMRTQSYASASGPETQYLGDLIFSSIHCLW